MFLQGKSKKPSVALASAQKMKPCLGADPGQLEQPGPGLGVGHGPNRLQVGAAAHGPKLRGRLGYVAGPVAETQGAEVALQTRPPVGQNLNLRKGVEALLLAGLVATVGVCWGAGMVTITF